MQARVIDQLVKQLARLPGVGNRSAKRLALALLTRRDSLMRPLAEALLSAAALVQECAVCGNLDESSPCHICTDPKRDATLVCVVETVGDVWAMERGRVYPGQYHVLGGVLSAIQGVRPEDLRVEGLLSRVREGGVREVILATNATLEGQTTAHYLADRLQAHDGLTITRLAQGIPIGGELDYLDEGTLGTALRLRQPA